MVSNPFSNRKTSNSSSKQQQQQPVPRAEQAYQQQHSSSYLPSYTSPNQPFVSSNHSIPISPTNASTSTGPSTATNTPTSKSTRLPGSPPSMQNLHPIQSSSSSSNNSNSNSFNSFPSSPPQQSNLNFSPISANDGPVHLQLQPQYQKPSFTFVCLGVGGGPLEGDCSCYLVKPADMPWQAGTVVVEGGE